MSKLRGAWPMLLALSACGGEDRSGVAHARDAGDPSGTFSDARVAVTPAFDSARTLYSEAAYDLARDRFRAIAEVAGASEDTGLHVRALTWAGLASWQLGDYDDARATGERALQLKLDSGLESQLWRSYNGLGLLAWNEGRLDDATRLLAQAVDRDVFEDPLDPFKTDNSLGLVHAALAEFGEARARFRRALEGFRSASATDLEARVLTNLAALEVDVGEPAAALGWLEEAMGAFEVIDDPRGRQNAVVQMGSAYMALGDPVEGFRWLDSALVLSRRDGLRREEARNLELLAQAHREAGDAVRALELFQEAAAIHDDLGLQLEMARDLRNQAELLAAVGSPAAGIDIARQALGVHLRLGALNEVLEDRIALSRLHLERDSVASARAHVEAADSLVPLVGGSAATVTLAISRGRLLLAEENPAEALSVLDGVTGILDRSLPTAVLEVHTLRARALRALEREDEAIVAARRAVGAVERIRGRFSSALLRRSYGTVRVEAYLEFIELLLANGRTEEAFEATDAARGRPLRAALSIRPSDTARQDAVLARLRTSESLLRNTDYLIFALDSLERLAGEYGTSGYEEEIRSTRSALDQIRLREVHSSPSSNGGDRSTGIFTTGGVQTASVRHLLAPDEALVQYLVADEGLHLFLVTRARTTHHWVSEQRRSLAARVRLARSLVAAPDKDVDASDQVLHALHERLIGPFETDDALEDVRHLIVVAHDHLVYLPFAALKDPTTDRHLVERWSLTHAPSAEAFVALRESDRGRLGASEYALGGAVLAPFPDDFPASLDETRDIASVLADVAVFEGSRATESRLRLSLEASAVVHVASHADLDRRNPLRSRVRLARAAGDANDVSNDGMFHVYEILDAVVASSLVFLSGCETDLSPAGATTFAPGDDYASLAQALLYAGAEHVIATLWPVRDRASAVFAQQFYRRLPGRRPAEVISGVQRAMLADSRYSHPFYWATYRVSGSSMAVSAQRTAAGSAERR